MSSRRREGGDALIDAIRPPVKNAVRRALLESDDLRRPPWRGSSCGYTGHCYVASEAFFHLLGGPQSGLTPATVLVDGVVHWFLRGPDGVIDLTADQFDCEIPYSEGRGRGFLTKQPSKRAQVLISRVRAQRV